MDRKDFYFDLPPDLIAQYPTSERGDDRLMTLERNTGEIQHHAMSDLPGLLPPNALMVFNDSRVRKSRVFAICELTGKRAEFLFLNLLSPTHWKVMTRNARRHKPGMTYLFPDGTRATIAANAEFEGSEFRELVFDAGFTNAALAEDWFEKNGHIPFPPYIAREDERLDADRYQTVYARETGSAAAPTAGLHFTETMLRRIADAGIETAWVTLHVGLGTFLPVRTDNIEDHVMHEEVYTINENTAAKINVAKNAGRPVIAVGTTSVRTLESAWQNDGIRANSEGQRNASSSTRIFIYPGYQFRVVDGIFTNFHTPESTLLMLVSAFAGKKHILNAYKCAIQNRYRFFSYGDAMLIA
jgi:S-adenosylmethionine:tRNA ribosyltransferase-isomerase